MSEENINKRTKDVVIELEKLSEIDNTLKKVKPFTLDTAPLYAERNNVYPSQNYYNSANYNPNLQSHLAQQLDGQNVYVAGPPPPQNVRNAPAFFRREEINPNQENDLDSTIFTTSFTTTEIRNQFVQKVYLILACQLGITFFFVLLPLRKFFVIYHFPITLICLFLYMVFVCALVCCKDLRRKFPINFVLLGFVTFALTGMVMAIAAISSMYAVLYAMGTTAILTLTVSIFASQTRWDVTGCGMCLCISAAALAAMGIIILILALFGIDVKILHLVYASLAVLLFSFFLMFDTQQIMGGRRIQMSPEEYICGALTLYIDIVMIFMYLLTIFESCER